MNETILVLGGTGMLGLPVARRLKEDGFQVRVLARNVAAAREVLNSSFKLIPGDVADQNSLAQALEGCWGVHISIGGPVDRLCAEIVGVLAPGLGIERIGYVSGTTVCEKNRWFPMTEQKLIAEEALRSCGVPYTIFCPTWPMEQLPRFGRGGKPFMIGKQPEPVHWFAAEDMAHMVAAAYKRPEAQNKRFYIHGPEAILMKEALARYSQAFHPDGEPVSVMPIWMAKALGVLTRNEQLKFAADLMAYFDKVGELGDPAEANQILGPPETTLEAWIAWQAGIGL